MFALLYVYSAAIQAIAAYLDAFQKIADAATNSRGKFKSRKHKKKHKKRNETLPPPAPRNCRNCTRTVRNIRYISYIHLLFMRLPSNVDGDSDCYSDVSVNVGHRSDFTHFTPISTRSSRVECLFFLFSGYSRISAFRYLYLFIGRASRSSLSLSLFADYAM